MNFKIKIFVEVFLLAAVIALCWSAPSAEPDPNPSPSPDPYRGWGRGPRWGYRPRWGGGWGPHYGGFRPPLVGGAIVVIPIRRGFY